MKYKIKHKLTPSAAIAMLLMTMSASRPFYDPDNPVISAVADLKNNFLCLLNATSYGCDII